jgi:hypothetical protein
MGGVNLMNAGHKDISFNAIDESFLSRPIENFDSSCISAFPTELVICQ